MRIIIAMGEEEKLLNFVIPRSFKPKCKKHFRHRMNWIIKLMEKDTGRPINELC